jgi:hypothetical protein
LGCNRFFFKERGPSKKYNLTRNIDPHPKITNKILRINTTRINLAVF